MKQALLRFLPPALWFAVIFILTSIPSSGLPDVQIGNVDKLVHFVIYLPFGFLLMRAMKTGSLRSSLTALALCLIAASCDELHQTLIPGRFMELTDLAADAAGGLSGIIIFIVKNKLKR